MVKPNGGPNSRKHQVRFDLVATIPPGVAEHQTHVQVTRLLPVDRVSDEAVHDLIQQATDDLLGAIRRVTLDPS